VTRGSTDTFLEAPVDAVWTALVAPGRRDWYFRLTPEGAFAEGEAIQWRDVRGDAAEESEIVEVDAPRRLVMHSRFTFAPAYAKQPPHSLIWDVAPEGSGSRVRLSWDASDPVAGFLASEAQYVLQSLRLAYDPVAQAEVARLPAIGDVEIHEVTPERVADYQAFFDRDAFRDFPGWQACYCMEQFLDVTEDEAASRTAADNRRDMSDKIKQRQVTALLAYADGKPVGWCNYGATSTFAALMHRYKLKAEDHEGVGSVACFVIAAPYRGHGIATRLLDAALDRLRGRGVKVVEAYPAKDVDSAQSNFRGPLAIYLRAGFEPYRETDRYLVVRKEL